MSDFREDPPPLIGERSVEWLVRWHEDVDSKRPAGQPACLPDGLVEFLRFDSSSYRLATIESSSHTEEVGKADR